ncbi:MAG: HNH endonuclease signature motif containing protein [Planctomycetota bacterium]
MDAVFDCLCPLDASARRGIRPFLNSALGALLIQRGADRKLQGNRVYHRLDLLDFIDFATSDLAPEPALHDFPDQQAAFYQGTDDTTDGPFITSRYLGEERGLTLTDAATARSGVHVSVIVRFALFEKPGEEWVRLLDGDKPLYAIAAMDFFPPTIKPKFPAELEAYPLIEWDRLWVDPPITCDRDWRFCSSGVYTDHVLKQMEEHPDWPGSIDPDLIQRARECGKENCVDHATYFELARLALQLPAYFAFMYDLVVDEQVRRPTPQSRQKAPRRSPRKSRPTYIIVKSINIIRPPSDPISAITSRKWTAPKYHFAVRGHWRHYADLNVRGHDVEGNPVLGKTWVTEYEKGKDKPRAPFPTTPVEKDPNVTIYIKQTLSYARDVIAAYRSRRVAASESSSSGHAVDSTTHTLSHDKGSTVPPSEAPSDEWQALERAKLTAGLRFLIMRRDGFRCQLCGEAASKANYIELEIDHRIPVAQWGRTVESNLWTLCKRCNRGKGRRLLE